MCADLHVTFGGTTYELHLEIAAMMPTMNTELERLVEELQKKLEKVQQFKGSIETAFQASMTSQFEEELARVVAAERI